MKTKTLFATLLLVLTTSVFANENETNKDTGKENTKTSTETQQEDPKDPGVIDDVIRQIICTINPKDCV